ncbi:MAG: PQQ-binding-like beta-propeller repeat protein, partial [Candidatus Hydrogenedentes bacterium]|nr:PQQ-binding-like beta-propeller repeat protein [Candidatus Hydrogenedentota bacterium]
MLEKREFDKSDFLWRLSTTVSIVAGLFSVLVFTLLIINYFQITRLDPVNHELLTQMRQDYASLPAKDEALAQRIRDLDLMTRKAFFSSQTHLHMGALVLLGSVVTFLIAFKYMIRWKQEMPELDEVPTADKEFLAYAQSRQLITWAGVGLLAGGMMVSYFTESALTAEMQEAKSPAIEEHAPVAEAAVAARPVPTWEELQAHWPSFRGPGSNGIAHFTTAPTEWDVEAGTNILWKVASPLPGNNSPVVWGDSLYMTGANAEKRAIYCYNIDSGELRWTTTLSPLPGTPTEELEPMEDTGFAASTMVAHGELVFACFANGDLVALDNEGNQVWGLNLGLPENHYGYSSSLLAYESLLFVQYDQSEGGKLLALNVATGKEAWTMPREKISWASPILAQTTLGSQLILSSEENADGYNPLTGKLLWSEECLGGEVAPSPAYSNGMVFVANEYAVASGISLGGTAEAVESKVAWEYDELLPEVSSPIGDGTRFYFGTAIGDFVALDAKTGEERWVEEMDEGF